MSLFLTALRHSLPVQRWAALAVVLFSSFLCFVLWGLYHVLLDFENFTLLRGAFVCICLILSKLCFEILSSIWRNRAIFQISSALRKFLSHTFFVERVCLDGAGGLYALPFLCETG